MRGVRRPVPSRPRQSSHPCNVCQPRLHFSDLKPSAVNHHLLNMSIEMSQFHSSSPKPRSRHFWIPDVFAQSSRPLIQIFDTRAAFEPQTEWHSVYIGYVSLDSITTEPFSCSSILRIARNLSTAVRDGRFSSPTPKCSSQNCPYQIRLLSFQDGALLQPRQTKQPTPSLRRHLILLASRKNRVTATMKETPCSLRKGHFCKYCNQERDPFSSRCP